MKIEKCPFCGGEAETFEASEDSFSILCTGCGVETPYLPYLTEAIAAWNRRVILDGCENELIVRSSTNCTTTALFQEELVVGKQKESEVEKE